MVNICFKCEYCKDDLYCERLGIHVRVNSPICEFYVKKGRKNGSRDKD